MRIYEPDMNWYVFITLNKFNEMILVGYTFYYFLDAIYFSEYTLEVGSFFREKDDNYIVTMVEK